MIAAKNKIILSPSRVKQYKDCAWLFYQTYFKKVPEVTHPKTLVGTLVHLILELLFKEKHRDHYELITKTRSVYTDPAIARLIRIFLAKNPQITPEIAAPLNELTFVALDHDFFQKGAEKVFDPEYSFEIKFEDFSTKGFIDRFALYKDHAVIRDFKTQGKKFTEKELQNNIQAHMYMLAIKELFNLPARVEFILVRHPPTKLKPEKHLQVVEPISDAALEGLKIYLSAINKQIENLDEKSAMNNLRACDDIGFCQRVCQLREPFDYYEEIDENGSIIKTSKDKIIATSNSSVKIKRYGGCPYFFGDGEAKRSLSFQ